MTDPKLSIIIPYVNEYPQVEFTIRAVGDQLVGKVPFEVIAVDNWCEQVAAQKVNIKKRAIGKAFAMAEIHAEFVKDGEYNEDLAREIAGAINQLAEIVIVAEPDRGHDRINEKGEEHESSIKCSARRLPWLKYVQYSDKLSHWNCKRVAVEEHAQGDLLLYLDAHVVPSRGALVEQYDAYLSHDMEEVGSLHLPLSYHVLESSRLIYKLKDERENGEVAYSFTGYRDAEEPYEVPCMSTCGMLESRYLYDKIKCWPPDMEIYSGGEHSRNFVAAILGYKKFIMPGVTLHHHGDKRGYSSDYTLNLKNRVIANYLFGGEEYALRLLNHKKGKQEVKDRLFREITTSLSERRAEIEAAQVCSIDEWLDEWTMG